MYRYTGILRFFLQHIVRFAVELLAVVMIVVSGYILYDMIRIQNGAYPSRELQKYRPIRGGDDEINFEKLMEINEDAAGWLTIYRTHIDYPVVQGEDDMEYVNKDVYGNFSITGSIYLTAYNTKDFTDPYCLVYGHHMDNGSMFGDIDRFLEEDFFLDHPEGLLVTPQQVYKLHFFSCISTNAYDENVYAVRGSRADPEKVITYALENAVVSDEKQIVNRKHILALSTCASAATNGRTVLYASMEAVDGTPQEMLDIIKDNEVPTVQGHSGVDYWALLNLLCMLLTVYITVPLHRIVDKFRRKSLMKDLNKTEEDMAAEEEAEKVREEMEESGYWDRNRSDIIHIPLCEPMAEDKKGIKYEEILIFRTEKFGKRTAAVYIMEVLLSIVSVILFFLTEDIRLPITVIDEWTPAMLLILAAVYFTDLQARIRTSAPEKKMQK